jgi:hypothetical protein
MLNLPYIYNDNRMQQVIEPKVLDAIGQYIQSEIIANE